MEMLRRALKQRQMMMVDPPYANVPRYGPPAIPKELGSDFEEAAMRDMKPKDKKKSLDMFDSAWGLVKDDMAEKKKALIACLKKEGGACGLDECCKACDMDRKSCKAMIDSMDNVKVHPSGDVILMDGLSKAKSDDRGYSHMINPIRGYVNNPYREMDPADPATRFRVPPSAVTPAMMMRDDVSSRQLMEENQMLREKVMDLEHMLDATMASGAIMGVGGHMTADAMADTGSRLDFMESEGVIDAILRRYAMMDPEMDGLNS